MTPRARFGVVFAAVLLCGACTARPQASPTPTPTTPVSATSTPTPAQPAVFDAAAVMAHDQVLAGTIGIREAGSRGYRLAADYAAARLARYGYRVTRQYVPVPSGTSQRVAVSAGVTQNVVAAPPGFDPAVPHLVVGAHLDTVVVTAGANDNGSGASMLLELARLARLAPTRLPIVWVEFGGEERRRPGPSGALYGSRWYLAHLSTAERGGVRGMISVDMVGNGPSVLVCTGGVTARTLVRAFLGTAERLGIKASERVVTQFFSDHTPFEQAGITVAWLWSGDNPTVHTPRDTMAIIQPEELARIGRVAWETLRTVRL